MKNIFLTYLILLLANTAFSQATYSRIDSLENELSFKVDSLINEINKSDSLNKAKLYNQIVWNLRNSNPQKAIEYGKTGLEIAKKISPVEYAKASAFVGVSYRNIGNFEEAFEYFQLGLKVAEDNNLRVQEGYAHNNFGNLHIYANDYKSAIPHLNKALKIAEETNNKKMIAYCKLNIGRASLLINDTENAFKSLKESLKIRKERKNTIGQAVCYKYIADTYLVKNEVDSAIYNYNKALSIGSKQFSIDLLADVYDKLARIQIKRHKLKLAKKTLDTCVSIALETDNPVRIEHAYRTKVLFFKKTGQFKKALIFQDSIANYKNKIYEDRLSIKSSNLNLKNKELAREAIINQFKKEKELDDTRYEQSKNLSYALGIIIALFVILGTFLFISNKKKKQTNILLNKQKDAIVEKNEELSVKNEEIIRQKDEIEIQHKAIERQQIQITDSILYAQRIQVAALPNKYILNEYFADSFVFFQPRDIVSGDFYWFKQIKNKVIITAADCTGHGVPGAFLSMLGMSMLNEIVGNQKIIKANEILENLRKNIKKSLHQTADSQGDGMDMALFVYDTKTMEVEFSGANNPLYIVRNKELLVFKPTLSPVGTSYKESIFDCQKIKVQKGDALYIFSDGYIDQFGGPRNRKFMTSRFKKLLIDINKHPMSKQKIYIRQAFLDWKRNYNQIDDVLVMGVEI